jgi:asparagine synthase (glutamine-hydrolysing)
MCGIAGAFGNNVSLDPVFVEGVRRMADAQTHRGPDDQGWLQSEDVILGHRRLSIVDLSSAGRQPMSNEDGSVFVAYNGEIYNHQELREALRRHGHTFSSTSDTEVIVHGYEEWGIEELLRRLRGMFAFAIYDARSCPPTLILSRDRFGIKPLYFTLLHDRSVVVFASEVRALDQSGLVPRDEDPRAWLAFLLFGSVPAPWTTINSVRALPPGHYLVADESGRRLTRYYSNDDLFIHDGVRSEAQRQLPDLEDEIRARLEEAVATHLISDAPLGVFLSGGIDSSALVALTARYKRDLVTLGVVFEEEAFSEEPYQRLVAERFQTKHHSIPVTLKEFQDEMKRFLDAMDQPTVDGLNTYFVARAAKQVGLKAVLSGIGGDEVFCGYPTLRRARILRRFHVLPSGVRAVTTAAGSFLPYFEKLAFLKKNGNIPFYLVQRGLFTPREAAMFLGAEEREAWALIESLEPEQAPQDPVVLQQFLETRHYLVDQLLKDADVFGMAHSIEIRVPFLDHVLVETALRAPSHLRRDRHWPKPLLTRSLQDVLPKEVVFRPKQGFTFPIEVWLRSTGRMFRDAASRLNPDAYDALWDAFLSGRVHWSRPWALVVLEHFGAGGAPKNFME